MICEVCLKNARMKCSGCKTANYCSAACQAVDSDHKKVCKMQQIVNEYMLSDTPDTSPPKRPADHRCTGCGVEFAEEEDEEEEDAVLCDVSCDECGYMACETCSIDASEGTCYCANSNFGVPYCEQVPEWFHCDGRNGRSYSGDRHPENADYPPEAYESVPRKCNNCGEMKRVLKKAWRRPR